MNDHVLEAVGTARATYRVDTGEYPFEYLTVTHWTEN